MTSSGILNINVRTEGCTQRFQDKKLGSVVHNILVTPCARIYVSLSVTNMKTFVHLDMWLVSVTKTYGYEFGGSVRRKQERMDFWCCYLSVNSRNISSFFHRNIREPGRHTHKTLVIRPSKYNVWALNLLFHFTVSTQYFVSCRYCNYIFMVAPCILMLSNLLFVQLMHD